MTDSMLSDVSGGRRQGLRAELLEEGYRSMSMKSIIARFRKDEDGATAIEYGLIAALIAVVIITAVTLLGENLEATFNEVANELVSPE